MKSPIRTRLEVWGGTFIIAAACIIMRYSNPGIVRTVVFTASVLVALYLIILSLAHAKRSDG
jgi:hypothetical protein